MIFLENSTDFPLHADTFEPLAQSQTQRDIELILVDDAQIAALNREHRGIERATDVLSFPLAGDHPHMPLGSIVISFDHARSKASELGHTVTEELQLLFLHGLLHLLGYDHETDQGQMREREHALIRAFNLPSSLIIRTESP